MTFRAKPVVQRSKPTGIRRDRRNFYQPGLRARRPRRGRHPRRRGRLSWYYNDHLAPVGSVAGQTITKDDLRDVAEIEQWRLDLGGAPHANPGRRRPADPGAGRAADADHASSASRSSACRSSRSSTTASRRTWRPRRASRSPTPTSTPSWSRRRRPGGASRVVIEVEPRTGAPPSRRPRSPRPGRRSTRRSPTSRAARSGRTSPGPSRPTSRPRAQVAISAGSAPRTRRPTRHSSGAVRVEPNGITDVVEGEDGSSGSAA